MSTTVPHLNTVKATLATRDAKRTYLQEVLEDLVAGNNEDATATLSLLLQAQDGLRTAASTLAMTEEELAEALAGSRSLGIEKFARLYSTLLQEYGFTIKLQLADQVATPALAA